MYLLIVLLSVICLLFYIFVNKKLKYWTNMGVVQSDPMFLLGNIGNMLFRTKSQAENVKHIYDQHPNSRYVGVYQFFQPTLMLRDPELIKQITIKDFDHFTDHRIFTEEVSSSELWGKNIFSLKGEQWKEMRATISPAFTSSKMRIMFELINDCAKNFTNYFAKKTKNTISVEANDVFTRYANDVIAITIFGIASNSLLKPNNEFYQMGEKASEAPTGIKMFLCGIYPKVVQMFGISTFSKELTTFFKNVVTDSIEVREKNNLIRPDLINILLQAKRGELKNEDPNDTDLFGIKHDYYEKYKKKFAITNEDIIGQALVFFFAGVDTVSRLMAFSCYELALNPDVQTKARKEILKILQENNGELTYDAAMQMKYLDAIILEALRKYPSVVNIDRNCVKPYVIKPTRPDEKPVHLKKNDVIWLPVFGLQRDPKYFPNPEKFDPERFCEQNRKHIKPSTFIAFGAGPRRCIGERFSLIEAKVVFVHLLSKFEIIPIEKTNTKLQFDRVNINLGVVGGIHVGFRSICK